MLLRKFLKKQYKLKSIANIKPTQILVIGFALIILIGSALLNLPISSKNGQSIGLINALFTATSAVCVTGLVVVDTFAHWSRFGQVVILILIQVGGLGFMTLATIFSLIFRRKISLSERLIIAEAFNYNSLQGIIKLTRRVLFGTFIIEGLGAVILSARFAKDFGVINGIYKGIFHSVSAFCNAGFDLMGELGEFSSLTFYARDLTVNIVVMFLIIAGGLGFVVWDDIIRTRNFKNLHLHTKLVLTTTGALLLLGFIITLIFESNNAGTIGSFDPLSKIAASMFHSVTPRTAGFNTINLQNMNNVTILLTMFLMFIGGSPGSTAGGIKTATFGVLMYTILAVIRGKDDTELFRRRISNSTVRRAFTLTFIGFLLTLVTSTIVITFDNAPVVAAVFESVSAFGTVGLSLGITPGLGSISKAALIVTMFFGRVGIFTIALALITRSQNRYTGYRYSEEKIIIG